MHKERLIFVSTETVDQHQTAIDNGVRWLHSHVAKHPEVPTNNLKVVLVVNGEPVQFWYYDSLKHHVPHQEPDIDWEGLDRTHPDPSTEESADEVDELDHCLLCGASLVNGRCPHQAEHDADAADVPEPSQDDDDL